MISKINMAVKLLAEQANRAKTPEPDSKNFGQFLKSEAENLVKTMQTGEAQGVQSVTGQSDINNLVTSLTDSRLAFKTVLGFRRELMQAWNELRQMQI
jgi:flagellar hook-basal body complex protein FliE